MEGKLGRAAWRWLFYVEGSLTVLVAILAMFVLPDFPETTSPGWLTQKEIRLAVKRMQEDSNESEDVLAEGHSATFWRAMKDPNVYILTMLMTAQILANSFNMYFPTLTKTLGYGRTVTLLLCAPPYICATFLTFFVSRWAG